LNRRQLEHVVRAAAAITGLGRFVLVGSQAALVQHRKLPPAMVQSDKVDLYPPDRPELAEVVDGAIGRDSPFHATFGYYADGVGPETAKLPCGWEGRAFRLKNPRTGGATAVAPELHDLAAAKLVAGREKDVRWVEAAIAAGLLRTELLAERVDAIEAEPALKERARALATGLRPR
jgi:hypothetical protein